MSTLRLLLTIAATLPATAWAQNPNRPIPDFKYFAVGARFTGPPAAPVIRTHQERRYRTRIREGVSQGRGVWNGSWKNPIEKKGPNFAGHYTIVRWGCGADCLMMAVVDAKTGSVYKPPRTQPGSEFEVPMDPMSEREIEFEPGSSLIVFKNVCEKYREHCGVYAFNWKDNRFTLVNRILIDLTKSR